MKTRIKIVEDIHGGKYYIAQKKSLYTFFIWENICEISAWNTDIEYTKADIDKYLKSIIPKKEKITYEEYPVTPKLPEITGYQPTMPNCKPPKGPDNVVLKEHQEWPTYPPAPEGRIRIKPTPPPPPPPRTYNQK